MIISHRYRFIFVKCEKTAGTSMEVFLSSHCGPDDVVTPISPWVAPHEARNHDGFFNHIPAHAIRDRIGPEIWNSYFKFCVERNPWDKTLSHFSMVRRDVTPTPTFEEYLAAGHFAFNQPKYTEPGSPQHVIVDEVLRYEFLMEDLGRTFRMLGVPFSGSLGVNAKSDYRTDRRPYREVYTPEQAAFVAELFKPECDLIGYTY